jgi:hypothetical protein
LTRSRLIKRCKLVLGLLIAKSRRSQVRIPVGTNVYHGYELLRTFTRYIKSINTYLLTGSNLDLITMGGVEKSFGSQIYIKTANNRKLALCITCIQRDIKMRGWQRSRTPKQ